MNYSWALSLGKAVRRHYLLLKQFVNYYTSRGSPVFMASLGAAKAFDRVNHYALFSKLMSIGIPVCVLNILIYWFIKLNGKILWTGTFSAAFCVKSSVQQGEIIIVTVFFLIYV